MRIDLGGLVRLDAKRQRLVRRLRPHRRLDEADRACRRRPLARRGRQRRERPAHQTVSVMSTVENTDGSAEFAVTASAATTDRDEA